MIKNEEVIKEAIVLDFFTGFNYRQKRLDLSLLEDRKSSITVLFNPNSEHFQIIYMNIAQNSDLIETVLSKSKEVLDAEYNKDFETLSILIGHNNHPGEYTYQKQIYLDDDYYEGIDLDNIYPGIKNILKAQDNKQVALAALVSRLNNLKKDDRKNLPFLQKYPYLVTYCLIGISAVMFLLQLLFEKGYSTSAVAIFFGADYMTFTLGLKQFYRFITSSFLHGGFLHVFLNCYSLYIVGRVVELEYGHLKFLIAFLLSVFIGNITSDILVGNQLIIGLSGGLYGLMFIYIKHCLDIRILDMRRIMPLIGVNIFINFMPNVAWQVHLGGLLGGFIAYWIFESKNKIGPILVCIITIAVLLFKYYTIKEIYPIYSGTDAEVTQIIYNLGYKDYALKLSEKLFTIYQKFGG